MEFNIDNLLTEDKKKIDQPDESKKTKASENKNAKEEPKEKSKGGRPKVAEPKNKPLTANFTIEEEKAIREKVEELDTSLAKFIRNCVLKEL